MRASACMLIVAFLCLQTLAAEPRDRNTSDTRTLVATMFGESLHLEEVTPENIETKRQELARGEFEKWLREYHGRRVYERIWGAALKRYVEREKIGVSDEELAAIAKSVEARSKAAPELPGDTFTPGQGQAVMVAWARGSLMDWKVCKALHEKYGGRVGIGSLGAWTAFDGQNALLKEHLKEGEIKFHHAEMEAAFWQHTKIKNFADAYPEGERLKQLLATPPYLQP